MAELAFPAPPLADAVVRLRPWRAADVASGLMRFADPLVQRFSWPQTTPYTEADARRFFADQEAARRLGEELNLAFTAPGDDEAVLGGGSLYEIELAQGRAAVKLTCGPDNIASQRVAARCGFTRQGLLRAHLPFKGAWRDTVVFGLLADEPGGTRR